MKDTFLHDAIYTLIMIYNFYLITLYCLVVQTIQHLYRAHIVSRPGPGSVVVNGDIYGH